MILTRPIRKHPRWFGYIGSSTTYRLILRGLPENAGKAPLPQGALLGLNDFKKTGYGGPCPPIGRHRYFHKLYALDITLDLREATKSQIERAMRGHVLANAEFIGTYQKGDR
jgi:Raf kinase inhibitor-like YbhB/YbcL family protein